MTLAIGNWVKREGAFRRHVEPDGTERWTGPRWHLVESVVAEDAVIRCGKRMDSVNRAGRKLEVSDVQPLTRAIGQPQLCRAGCQREDEADAVVVADDIERHADTPAESFTPLADVLAADDASTHDESEPA